MTETSHTTYVLGTGRDELERLLLQHNLWSEVTHTTWKKAGIRPGTKVIDLGAGPGYCTLDLARLVGPTGQVAALERSKNYLAFIEQAVKQQYIQNVTIHDVDLVKENLPIIGFDVAWCRWVCCFLTSPERLIEQLAKCLTPGGSAIFYEYVDYASWRMLPHEPMVEEFVQRVMATWRQNGGEPDIAPRLVKSLQDNGFTIKSIEPKVWCVRPGDKFWQWVVAYMRVNTKLSMQDGVISLDWADRFMAMIDNAERDKSRFMITPMMLEIIAEC